MKNVGNTVAVKFLRILDNSAPWEFRDVIDQSDTWHLLHCAVREYAK